MKGMPNPPKAWKSQLLEEYHGSLLETPTGVPEAIAGQNAVRINEGIS
jgi:hypothetical protein